MTGFVKRSREEAEETTDRMARRIAAQAIYRSGARPIVQSTITPMTLPSDEIKGRIIGREGRNIRALESATGVDIIIDDTPHTLLLSSYDPSRRELARITIERLIEDGRIHPARIEEVTLKVREEMEDLTLKAGEAAALELGLAEIHARMHRLLGRLRFRLSHGHNMLQHSLEVAYLAGYMAAELGAKTDIVRRAGLLHEVAQAEDEPPSLPVVLASGDLAAKLGESDEVVHAIKAIDRSVEPRTMEALLVAAANRISEHRPGARKDNLEVFIERQRNLEEIALSFPGVKRAFSVRSGKDLRVMVESEQVTDEGVVFLSHDIATRIEKEVDYPGQVRVSVIREIRAIDYAV
jgi:ribonuclease Y